jgi:4-amino-4-deoxy-L-arabinose transferase-like glycosyltransferase
MRRRSRTVALAAILAAFGSFALSVADLNHLPFHPDESSWIFMSHDFDTALTDFGRLRWRRGAPMTGGVRLRLLDAPIPKYAIGLGRWIRGYRNVPTGDWDWTESWEDNISENALPAPRLLQTARLTAVALYALSIGVFVWLAIDAAGLLAAAIATLLLVLHPLEQLHLRRAMAESTLQLFSLLVILALVRFVKARPDQRRMAAILVGVALGLAGASKQSAVALAVVAFCSAVAVSLIDVTSLRDRLRSAVLLTSLMAVPAAVTFVAVNPVLYDQPLRGGYRMATSRQVLLSNQAKFTATVTADMVLSTISSRLRASYREVFWNPPSFSEFAEYDEKIAPDVNLYHQRWLTRVADLGMVRWLFLSASLLGFGVIAFEIARHRFGRRTLLMQLLLYWTLAQVAFIAVFVPLDWQRYFVPLLPPVCLLAGSGVALLTRRFYTAPEIA